MGAHQQRLTAARTIRPGAAPALEVLGALLIGVALALVYPPLAWLWAGLACFAGSFALEHARAAAVRSRWRGAVATSTTAPRDELEELLRGDV